ncbi:MAG: hypothetical protein CMN31_27185 [Sandaracinus sp.]|nr:hypothetical protein [Sandaracinus sp.]MBJ74973.1 hypothetical protein [Sandaracinus sp.]HJL03465.1 L,D-transpeptidase [Polyangiaceae bacterium LLY-WYZ-15_(1-7)]
MKHVARTTHRWALALAVCALGCGGEEGAETVEPPGSVDRAPRGQEETVEAEGPESTEDEPEPEPQGPPKRIFARRFVVPVRSEPNRESDRIGYLRGGAVLMATTAEPVGREGCRGGWYELTTGGFVCNRLHVTAFEGERLPQVRGRQPRRQDPLPYEYGFIRRRVPMYRNVPSLEQAAEHEGFRLPGQEPPPSAMEGGMAAGMGEAGSMMEAAMVAAGMEGMAATAMGAVMEATAGGAGMSEGAMAAAMDGASMVAAMATDTPSPMAPGMGASMETVSAMRVDPEPAEGETGTNLETAEDAEPDAGPTLESLQGDPDSILSRWLMRGFFVSLDRDFRRDGRRYWRTQSNGFVPYPAVMKRTGSEFQGVQLAATEDAPPPPEGEEGPLSAVDFPAPEASAEGEAPAADPEATDVAEGDEDAEAEAEPDMRPRLPYAWNLSSRNHHYQRTERGRFRRRGRVAYHEGFPVVEEVEDGRRTYLRSPDGRWFRDADVRVARQRERPDGVGPEDKWIDVDLTNQVVVLYRGDTPIYATLTSTGKPVRNPENPEETWETLTGLFRVKSKHLTDTMDGDTAVDGPYSVDDVPYVMYFELAYALHSAFWHNGFGRPRSHGCVNLTPRDARWVFEWADPQLPEGWHSVYPTEENPGTFIHVHGETPRR